MSVQVALCEDNDAFRESLMQFINDSPGFSVVAAKSDARSLLEDMRHQLPDVVLMDIDMPGMSGIEATELIKSSFPEIDVLILTVYEDDQKIFDAILAGASGYLLKKTAPHRILEAISEIRDGGASMSASIVKKVISFFSQTFNGHYFLAGCPADFGDTGTHRFTVEVYHAGATLSYATAVFCSHQTQFISKHP